MSQNNETPVRLVQIQPLKRTSAEAAASATSDAAEMLQLPTLTDWDIFWKKAYIGWRKVIGFTYTKHSYGATRRWLLAQVLPDKILYRWKPYQRGGCNRCGLCCKIVFRCPFFYENGETTACLIYKSEKHWPSACVAFPVDPYDLSEVQREVAPAPCPFHFEGQPEHPTIWGAVKAELRSELGKRVDKLKEAFNF
ncbi:MAG: hypothetical protein JNJ50_19215 [Acidobacteria bacterium]|nr:hypothetical protein [Acidobacteriota bacterium]